MRLSLLMLLSLFAVSMAPTRAAACSGPACHSSGVEVDVNVNVRAGGGGGGCGGGFCGGGFRRPICPIGDVGPGCVAPARKFARGVGRAGFRVARGIARVGAGIARGAGRLLFGRRCRC